MSTTPDERILVIDDEEFVRTAVQQILEEKGYTVLLAADGRNGLELARRERPDLVICDIVMEGFDGFSTLQEMRRDPAIAAIPLIIMTGYENTNSMRLAMSLGADDFLVKPFPLYELLSSVEARLKVRNLVQQQARERLDELKHHVALALPPEIQGPLASIITTARFLSTHADDLPRDQIRDLADIMEAASLRLRRLSENFMILAQLDLLAAAPGTSGLAGSTDRPSTRSVVEEAALEVAQARSRDADLQMDLADGEAAINPQYLGRVVEELVDNACLHTPTGRGIVVSVSCPDGFRLAVEDHGEGMPAEVIDGLAASVQFDQRLAERAGRGLGLEVARRLVEGHGGTLEIESRPGEGTTVVVSLPRV